MLTRIRLRRTASSLNSLSNNANENHHLRYGEALYSFADHMMVVGTQTDQVISNIPNRIIAFPKVSKNLVFSGPASGNNAYPGFRKLTAADMPDVYKNKGSNLQPIYINSSGVPTAVGYTIEKNIPATARLTDYYTSAISFTYDSTNNNIKLSLTRTNKTNDETISPANIVANIPKISSTTAGVVPKGAAVTSQTQNTKFLREDGTWQKPSYTTNVNTTYTFKNGTDGSFTVTPLNGSAQKVTVGKPATAGTADVATKVGTSTVGTTYIPIYLDSGTPKQVNAPQVLTQLNSDVGATVFQATPRPGVTGTLKVTNGGTGKASWTANQLVYATATNALGQLAPAQANQVIMSDANKKPVWSDPSNLMNASLDNTYVWDTVTYDKRYAGREELLTHSLYMDVDKDLGSPSAGFVSLSPLSAAVNLGNNWSFYSTALQSLNYSITVYENCTKSYNGGNLICTLTGVAAQKTFPYTALSGVIVSNREMRPCNGAIYDADELIYTPPGAEDKRKCYIVAGIHGENYQITNPGIPTRFNNSGIDEQDSTNWILYFHGHSTANLPTLECYAFQCLLPVSGGYRVTSGLQVAFRGKAWGSLSIYDVEVSYGYYLQKEPLIYYISSNWAVTTGAYNLKTHGVIGSGTARTFNLRRGSFTSKLSGKLLIGSRTGNDASSFRISFTETKSGSTLYIIPRLIIYGNSKYLMYISTVNLDSTTLTPTISTDLNSSFPGTANWYPAMSSGGSSTCTGLTISLASSSATSYSEYFNKAGESYTYYGFA